MEPACPCTPKSYHMSSLLVLVVIISAVIDMLERGVKWPSTATKWTEGPVATSRQHNDELGEADRARALLPSPVPEPEVPSKVAECGSLYLVPLRVRVLGVGSGLGMSSPKPQTGGTGTQSP